MPLDESNPLGFKRSYEYAPQSFPPLDLQNGSTYFQTPSNYDELALEPVSAVSSLLLPDIILQASTDTVQYTGGVIAQTVRTGEGYVTSAKNYMDSLAAQGKQVILNLADST